MKRKGDKGGIIKIFLAEGRSLPNPMWRGWLCPRGRPESFLRKKGGGGSVSLIGRRHTPPLRAAGPDAQRFVQAGSREWRMEGPDIWYWKPAPGPVSRRPSEPAALQRRPWRSWGLGGGSIRRVSCPGARNGWHEPQARQPQENSSAFLRRKDRPLSNKERGTGTSF